MVHIEAITGNVWTILGMKFSLSLNLNFEQHFLPCKRSGQEWVVENDQGRWNNMFKSLKMGENTGGLEM